MNKSQAMEFAARYIGFPLANAGGLEDYLAGALDRRRAASMIVQASDVAMLVDAWLAARGAAPPFDPPEDGTEVEG